LEEPLRNTIIVLIGFAGTGKYTIGRELCRRTGAKLVDNHLINNSLFTVVNADGLTPLPGAIWSKVRAIRQVVYETIRELSPPEMSFVFTMQLFEDDPQDHAGFAELVELAQSRRSLLVPVRLVCELEELCRRIVTPGRAAMLKQISSEAARRRAVDHSLLNPTHPNLITLDVTHKSAAESAAAILEEIRSIAEIR